MHNDVEFAVAGNGFSTGKSLLRIAGAEQEEVALDTAGRLDAAFAAAVAAEEDRDAEGAENGNPSILLVDELPGRISCCSRSSTMYVRSSLNFRSPLARAAATSASLCIRYTHVQPFRLLSGLLPCLTATAAAKALNDE